jgi:hypothetical protein
MDRIKEISKSFIFCFFELTFFSHCYYTFSIYLASSGSCMPLRDTLEVIFQITHNVGNSQSI